MSCAGFQWPPYSETWTDITPKQEIYQLEKMSTWLFEKKNSLNQGKCRNFSGEGLSERRVHCVLSSSWGISTIFCDLYRCSSCGSWGFSLSSACLWKWKILWGKRKSCSDAFTFRDIPAYIEYNIVATIPILKNFTHSYCEFLSPCYRVFMLLKNTSSDFPCCKEQLLSDR